MAELIESGEVRVPGDEEDSVRLMAGGVGTSSFQASVFPGQSTDYHGIGFNAYFKRESFPLTIHPESDTK